MTEHRAPRLSPYAPVIEEQTTTMSVPAQKLKSLWAPTKQPGCPLAPSSSPLDNVLCLPRSKAYAQVER